MVTQKAYNGYSLEPPKTKYDDWTLWYAGRCVGRVPDNDALEALHHLMGGECGDESCKCWTRGRNRGIEDQREEGRPHGY